MESSSTNIPTLPPTGAVEGDAALLAVEAEKVKEAKVDGLAPKSDTNDQTHGKAKKVPQAGLGNYFVSRTRDENLESKGLTPDTARLRVRDSIGLFPHQRVQCYIYWSWYSNATDECRLW